MIIRLFVPSQAEYLVCFQGASDTESASNPQYPFLSCVPSQPDQEKHRGSFKECKALKQKLI